MDNGEPLPPPWTIIERRELRFSPDALLSVVGWSLEAANVHGLPPAAPDAIRLLPQENRVDLLYGQGTTRRSVPLKVEALGSMLIAYCVRVRIPLRRMARKEVRVATRHVALVFHVEHSQASVPEVLDTAIVRHSQLRQWR